MDLQFRRGVAFTEALEVSQGDENSEHLPDGGSHTWVIVIGDGVRGPISAIGTFEGCGCEELPFLAFGSFDRSVDPSFVCGSGSHDELGAGKFGFFAGLLSSWFPGFVQWYFAVVDGSDF